jgi:hypothetical protein
VLSQIVSQASPTYTYDLRLSDSLEFRESRPVLGISLEVSGYRLCQIFVDERSILIRDKLPLEALRTIVQSAGFLEPIYVSRSLKGKISAEFGGSEEVLQKVDPVAGESRCFVRAVLQRVGRDLGVDIGDFREISQTSRNLETNQTIQPQPLYLSTALEIGVLPNPNVPSLVSHLLPSNPSRTSVKYLQKLLISPPPHHFAQHFREILHLLSEATQLALPKMATSAVGKMVSLLSVSRCNAASFREMLENMRSVKGLLSIPSAAGAVLSSNLLPLVAFESGVSSLASTDFLSRLSRLIATLSQAIAPDVDQEVSPPATIPEEFLRRNEVSFRGIFMAGRSLVSSLA